MARQDVLNRLKELGWDGPTSYTLPYLNEMITTLEGGTTVDQLKETRKKTSSAEVKGNGRAPKGEWVQTDPPENVITTINGGEDGEVDGVQWKCVFSGEPDGSGISPTEYWKFVPTVKQPKVKVEKGTWEACENPGIEVSDVTAEQEKDGVRYRLVPPVEEGGSITWEKFVPTPKKQPKLRQQQQANFDPREMLRVFENDDMRIRTGGRDWTMVPVEFLEEQLVAAQGRGEAAVLVDIDGSKEACDVVWLEALVAVKKRLALREEPEVNGDGDSSASTD